MLGQQIVAITTQEFGFGSIRPVVASVFEHTVGIVYHGVDILIKVLYRGVLGREGVPMEHAGVLGTDSDIKVGSPFINLDIGSHGFQSGIGRCQKSLQTGIGRIIIFGQCTTCALILGFQKVIATTEKQCTCYYKCCYIDNIFHLLRI